MSTCVDFIIEYDCADATMCAINCASDTTIDRSNTKIIPFNNYGQYYLRTRICLAKVQEQRLQRYSVIQQVTCSSTSDFSICNRWIPPSSFVPVALPINTTYIEIDSCIITNNGSYSCLKTPGPQQVYGNSYLFPTSFEVSPSNSTTCTADCKLFPAPFQYKNTLIAFSYLLFVRQRIVWAAFAIPLSIPLFVHLKPSHRYFFTSLRLRFVPQLSPYVPISEQALGTGANYLNV